MVDVVVFHTVYNGLLSVHSKVLHDINQHNNFLCSKLNLPLKYKVTTYSYDMLVTVLF